MNTNPLSAVIKTKPDWVLRHLRAPLATLVALGMACTANADVCKGRQTSYDLKVVYQVIDKFNAHMQQVFAEMVIRLNPAAGKPPKPEERSTVTLILAGDHRYSHSVGALLIADQKTNTVKRTPFEYVEVEAPGYRFRVDLKERSGRIYYRGKSQPKITREQAAMLFNGPFAGFDTFAGRKVTGHKTILHHKCEVVETAMKYKGCFATIKGHEVELESTLLGYGEQFPITKQAMSIEQGGCAAADLFAVPQNIKWLQ